MKQCLHRNPALVFSILFAGGIILGWIFMDSLAVGYLIIINIILLLASLIWQRFTFLLLVPLIILTGAIHIHHSLSAFQADHIILKNIKQISSIEGWISQSQFRENGKHRYVLELEKVSIDSNTTSTSGKVYLFQGKYPKPLIYGQRIRFSGKLQFPPLPGNPGSFNFRKYLQLQHIYFQAVLDEENCSILLGRSGNWLSARFLNPLRNKMRTIIESHVPKPTAAVVRALVLGERYDLDQNILEQFQRSGIVHVLAISGLHVGFVLILFLLIFGLLGLGYRQRVLFSMILLFVFVALVNFKAPVLRAALMAVFFYGAGWGERKVSSLNVIGLAAFLILIFSPEQLLLPGFQFSFAAVGGILYGYPKLKRYRLFQAWPYLLQKWLVQPFLVSFSAVVFTTPLTWYYYGTLQTGAVLINILLIPLIGIFVMLCFIFMAIAGLGLGISDGFGQLLHFYFSFILKINGYFANLPYIQIQLGNPHWLVLLLLCLLIFLIFQLRRTNIVFAFALIIALILIQAHPNSKLRVTFANVGQGDGSIFEFPDGRVMLVDAGDYNFNFDAGKRYMAPILKYYGIHRITYLVGSHAHSDHFGGMLYLLDHFAVDTLILNSYMSQNHLYLKLIKKANSFKIPVLYKERGQTIAQTKYYRVYVLHPYGPYLQAHNHSGNEVNNSSLVLKICYGDIAFLLTGDLERNAENALFSYADFLNSDVLKVGHHGSRTSTTASFLEWIKPDYSIVSVGKHNHFYHPSKLTIERLKAYQARPLRTDHFGALVFESDGKRLHLVNWR